MRILLGVDIGTTSVKVLASHPSHAPVASSEVTYTLLHPEPDFREQDPDFILQSVEKAIREVVQKLDAPPAGVCFSAAMHSVLAVDVTGKPLTHAILWADTRSTSYAEQLRKSAEGHAIYERTGTPIHPMTPLCKLAWLRDHAPEIFQKAHKFISLKEYFFYRWFGHYVVDYSIASASGLFNIWQQRWDEGALAWAGIRADQLSTPLATTHCLRGLKPEAAQALHLPADTPFVVGSSDGCMANLGTGGLRAQEATLTLGTSGAIRLFSTKATADPKMRIFDYLLTDRYHLLGGPTNNGGIVLDWVMQSLYPDLQNDYNALMKRVAVVPPGAEGVLCLPYLNGERAPYWDGGAVGMFWGVRGTHTRDHMARAALEGVMLNMYLIGQALEAVASPFEAIRADGGMLRTAFMVQLLADVFGKPVYASDSVHGADRGAILLGAWALGWIGEDADEMKGTAASHVVHPNAENHQRYQQLLPVFKALYTRLSDLP
ncbi:gluconokinase [Catalinimonas alkaloidigena]|uniref:Gluconokinase n=1 Tax=Catalinimonas alkaloidigena TaxID=1075417 RepID=A0A1G8WXN5_9BACT|nr:gluconokinase [Catalinimonas alkaloidigena]SDJ82310.1 gluconokinase [Catalinimonas alkaloidigena]